MGRLERRLAVALGLQKPEAGDQKSEVRSRQPERQGAELIEEAVAVTSMEPDKPGNDSAPWPGEVDESLFLGEQRAAGGTVALPVALRAEPAEEKGGLPPLEELVARIPIEARAALDELFRAKFVGVRRVRPQDLKEK
jgi:hypothetical protein